MNQSVKLKTFEEYSKLVDRYNRKGRITNDYLQNEAADIIIQDNLFAIYGDKNAVLLVQKAGFQRLYYYVNDIDEKIELPRNEYVTEILFRGENAPAAEVGWLEEMGFKKNLRRDLMFAKYADLAPSIMAHDIAISKALTIEEVKWAAELFNSTFDKWSGDFISSADYPKLLKDNAILVAKDYRGNLIGAFESGVDKGVNWLRHFAVTKEARGKGVGKALFDAVLEKGHVDDKSRYMLWVQHNNAAARQLYEKKGFLYMGKSTLSMIKL